MPYDEPDHDDPMEFIGVFLPAATAEEEDEMVRCVIEEYCWLGWDETRLWRLFTHPFYQATHEFCQRRGIQYVRRLMEDVLSKTVELPTMQVMLPVLN